MGQEQTGIKLPYMNADPNSVTVSGHSAGCYMSERMLIVYSDTIHGAGLFQCWPIGVDYWEDLFVEDATASSLSTAAIQDIDDWESAGLIDQTSNLASKSVYIYSGAQDDICIPKGQEAQQLVYQHYGVTDLHYLSEDVGHEYENDRMVTALKQIYEDLGYVSSQAEFHSNESNYEDFGSWEQFSQQEFVGIDTETGQAWDFGDTNYRTNGRVYIPDSCRDTQCRLHVAFHGCYSSPSEFHSYSEYNHFAANNNIIVLYPHSLCQNAYGWVDEENWMTNKGLYEKATKAMICRLTSEEESNNCPMAAVTLQTIGTTIAMALMILNF